MRWAIRPVLACGTLLLTGPAAAQDADVFRQQCGLCHAAVQGEPDRQGPNLWGVVGRRAGSMKGFAYSAGFRKALAGKPWTEAAIDRWITDPQTVAPGSVMAYQQPDADKRLALIEYLKTLR